MVRQTTSRRVGFYCQGTASSRGYNVGNTFICLHRSRQCVTSTARRQTSVVSGHPTAVGIAKAHNSFEHATAKIRLEKEELKRLLNAQKSELQQVQNFAKKMKQYGATEEIRRLIDSGLEELKHRIDGMEKVGDELSSTIKTQAASMEELHNLLQRDATENANRFTALEGALKTEHQSNFDAMIEKKFNDFDNKLQVALDGQSNSFHNLLTSKFREEIQTLVRTTANEHSDQQASKFNSLCDTNAAIIMELTDDCSRHLREDVKT